MNEDKEHGTGSIRLGERLLGIEKSLVDMQDVIADGLEDVKLKMAEGIKELATLNLRTRALEIIVYGGCSIALIAVLTAVLVTVIHSDNPPTTPTTKTASP